MEALTGNQERGGVLEARAEPWPWGWRGERGWGKTTQVLPDLLVGSVGSVMRPFLPKHFKCGIYGRLRKPM